MKQQAIGLMSGTSLDGIDAALITTDGNTVTTTGHWLTAPYASKLREQLRELLTGKGDRLAVERAMTIAHAEAVKALLLKANLMPQEIGVIGFHGQTILHAPERGITVQIGDGALLAEQTGITVVNDFRSRDVRAGGQGAPLVPLYHAALAEPLEKPLAVLNIGGVANITYIGQEILAFDTGPGNALLDDWLLAHTGVACDQDGKLAASGTVNEALLRDWLKHPYFAQAAPKSLDRNEFKRHVASMEGLLPADGAATLTAFTAHSIALAVRLLPAPPKRWLIAGGGRHNPTLMRMLNLALGVTVEPCENAGWNGDALEAQAFGYLAVRSLHGLPLSLPTTTGVKAPTTGGVLHRA